MSLKANGKTKVAIVYRPDSATALNLAKTLCDWLKERKHSVYTAPKQRAIRGTTALKDNKALNKCDLVIVLGGDGTYLRAVRMIDGHALPILGVNLGSLGFLTTIKAEELFTAVEHTLKRKMEMRPRSMISVKLISKGKTKLDLYALNDVVIERGSFSQLINVTVKSNKSFVSHIKADGIIVSSPTGSTAYNLAAGGPILHPDVKAIVLTPVAPHSLTSRPFVFPDHIQLSLKLATSLHTHAPSKTSAHFVVDGMKWSDLGPEDEIVIEKSDKIHSMIVEPEHDFFNLLREKLKFGERV